MSDRIYSIPDGVKARSGQAELAEGVRQLMERVEAEKEDLSATQLIIDKSNKISFPGYPYLFEANNKKIIVSIDIFKSGYECKVCKGRKRKEVKCECEQQGRAGLQYSSEQIGTISDTLGSAAAESRRGFPCPLCLGDYFAFRRIETCPSCKGIGATLVLPDTSKNLPTTGVVVSIGPLVKIREDGKTKYGYGIGDRVLFGPYAGNMIPTKAGILFKIMDASAVWSRVEGADDMGQFDFILQEGE